MKSTKQKGVAAVEFALILPFLLVMVFGITELGRAFYQYNALVKATRDAVRYLARQDLATGTATLIRNRTKLVAVCGSPTCDDPYPARFPGLTLAQAKATVTLCDYLDDSPCVGTHKGVLTGQGTADLVSVMINGPDVMEKNKFKFRSIVQPATPQGFGWGIPDIVFSQIKTTMVGRYN